MSKLHSGAKKGDFKENHLTKVSGCWADTWVVPSLCMQIIDLLYTVLNIDVNYSVSWQI